MSLFNWYLRLILIKGFGKFYNKDGLLEYEGEFENEYRDGNGIQIFSDGSRYEGKNTGTL